MIQHTATTIKTKSYIVIFFWLLIVGIAFGINYSSETRVQNDLAFQTARAFFDQIVISRAWNAGYGGVYVRYLKISNQTLTWMTHSETLQPSKG